ncbi:MAG TPA: transglycosylase domain-containing protein, partial [Polyangia bacterium]
MLALVAVRIGARVLPHPALRERVPLSTAITARDGTLLRLTLAADGQYRRWTRLEEISPLLIEATLLYEDRHFYRHVGVNPVALVRAARATYGGGSRRMGGSTLTMQLARRLWSISSRTPSGKVLQIVRALQLEAQYSKREILEAYLNLAPYGGNVEGVGAASAIYFGKRPSALTLPEALTLAVVPQSPTRRSAATRAPAIRTAPADAPPDGSLDRARETLLATWRRDAPARLARWSPAPSGPEPSPDLGSGAIDWPLLGAGSAAAPAALPFLAPHFVDHVLTLPAAASEAGAGPAPDTATVATTLDLPLQRLCERHLRAYVARQRARGIGNAAAMLVDSRTMAVRALVGSADFFDDQIAGQVNGALAPRSPGSTLKPFVYALGLDQGIIHPATMLRDVPTSFAAYSPENFDGRFVGPLSAKDALIRSRNVPALSVAARVSRPNLYDLLKTSGVALPFPEAHYGLGLAIGTGEVTMEDLVRLYGALANDGVVRSLVWRRDEELARGQAPHAASGEPARATADGDRGVRLVSEEAAFLVLDMLLDNPAPGARHPTAASARPVPVAWKTGTSWGFRDAWAVGVFGSYVLAVWVGDFSGAGNPAFVGAEAAAPLFFQIVDAVAARDPGAASFAHAPPSGVRRVQVCALSGGLPTAHCPHRRSSWFIPGRSPIEPCAIHRELALDATGRRTCPSGPPAVRHEVFEVWPSDLAHQFTAAGLPRRALPPAAPGCEPVDGAGGEAPRITSPLAGVTYQLRRAPLTAHSGSRSSAQAVPGPDPRADTAGDEPLALQAVTGGDAAEVFWFADQAFIGKAARGKTLFWRPPG